MTKFISIKNWDQYQHYKDRNPPWIKLHREILTSETWADSDDETRVLAIAIMLLAAATDNKIKLDAKYVKRVAYLNSEPDFSRLIEVGFVEIIDENDLDASTLHTNDRPETEKRQRHIKKDSSKNKKKEERFYTSFGSPQQIAWDSYREMKEGKRWPRDKRGGWQQPTEWPPGFENPSVTS